MTLRPRVRVFLHYVIVYWNGCREGAETSSLTACVLWRVCAVLCTAGVPWPAWQQHGFIELHRHR
jgi:hypothetical protein